MKRFESLLKLGLVVSIILSVCLLTTAADTTPTDVRKTAPNFTLVDSKGASVRLSDYKGKVVLLDFWATWCHGCKTEIPWYMEFQQKYRNKGLSVIGVAMDEDGWKSVKPYIEETKINYTIVVGNEELAKKYGADSLPVTLLIDREGKIAESHAGMVDKATFEKDLQMLVQPTEKGRP
jgi:cytochrome c biogenesis protein CcmG/thiol:disulfide interchange protein DsbE